jgi:NAD(P)-dependent dehydrogenase (short-subunit alcohol dehydrogenase family)
MGKLTGKAAVVTGASKGIGASTAKALAAEGAAVVANYSSSKGGRCGRCHYHGRRWEGHRSRRV